MFICPQYTNTGLMVKKKANFKSKENFIKTLTPNKLDTFSELETKFISCLDYFAQRKTQNLINLKNLEKLNIPNFRIINNKGVCGETLSKSGNCKFIPLLKENGINTIIDLRTADYTPRYEEKCKQYDLNYLHIPIDKDNVSNREILDNLPKLFSALNKGHFYMACAQGRHRTDIALAINYVFNPEEHTPPLLKGHMNDKTKKIQGIYTRLNSLYKAMTEEDKTRLGWSEKYDLEFKKRKQELKEFNKELLS